MPRHPKSKQRLPRPLLRNTQMQQNRPPGLKGKEIGLYHRNQQKRGIKQKKSWIHLRIPQAVILGIYKSLEKIEKTAIAKNIYLPPAKTLEFVVPLEHSDFIPLNAPDSDELIHTITNIHKGDDDVVIVKREESEAIEIDSSSDEITDDTAAMYQQTSADEAGIFVSNNYSSSIPSTSSANNKFTTKKIMNIEYKYGYNDIITETFQEKLDECVAQGILINYKNPEINGINDLLKKTHQLMLPMNIQYRKMLTFRETLPTYKKAADLLTVIKNNQVIVISGETGCGKSTQVPQLILDEAISNGRGANVKILVTEPRRIAASSLALRVAEERGEPLGKSVGYAVRLESVTCRERGSIMFCTTGVMLVELEQNQALNMYSHVILDEVHERDCQIDIAMCMLKQVLKKRKDLKLILMSATIDAESLSQYFDNCPMIHIEGLAYPVKDIYMEEILKMTQFKLPPRPNLQEYQPKRWHKYVKKHRTTACEFEKDIQYKASIAPWLQSIKATMDPEIFNLLQDSRIEEMNIDLIIELLKCICRGDPGAILVFVPGISDISKLMSLMKKSQAFPESSYSIFALHSKLPTIDQNLIFKKPPPHIRKIIIATNIAETSITIDDVVYVVDSGRMKYKGLDVEKNFATLQSEWISKANLRQRRGRAGRCQPGICYHLLTSHRAEMLPDRLLPELQRSDLLEEVLCIKKLRLGKAEEALNNMPAVPAEKTIKSAIRHLQQIGALDENETLTPLGWHLARLPVHPAAGKLLLLGTLFGCLDRAASVAAVWGFKDPFQLVIGLEQRVEQAKRDFAMGEPSDHVAMSEAIMQWEQCGSFQERRQFAYDNFLANNTLQLLSDMKRQFADNLKQMGFLNEADIRSSWANRNINNLSLFKAIVAASLYPNIATVKWSNAKRTSLNKPIRISVYIPEDGKVSMHPSSVMCTKIHNKNMAPICRNVGANWLVYWLKQKSSELFLIDVTCVYTLPLLFFGDLHFTRADNPDECFISISSFKVCCKKETAQLLFQLRSLLDQVLTSRIAHSAGDHSKRHFELDEQVLGAVIDLITAEDEGTQYVDNDDDDDNFEAVCKEETLTWHE